jgi:CheY-like chemotaxis protein
LIEYDSFAIAFLPTLNPIIASAKLNSMVIDLTRKTVVAFTDDDEDDYLIYSDVIRSVSDNIQLVYLDSCDALLQYLQQHTPDLMFLDINLGGMSGVDCIKHIRLTHSAEKLPIIIQSTDASQSVIDQCMNYGANYYLAKPKNLSLLEQQVRELFGREW